MSLHCSYLLFAFDFVEVLFDNVSFEIVVLDTENVGIGAGIVR